MPVLERGGDREREAWARLGWARALGARGETRRALTLAESALDRVEALRRETQDPELRAALLASRRASGELAIDLAIDLDRREPHQGWDAYALALSERAHARSLLDLAATESPEPPDPVFAPTDSRWKAARLPEALAVRGASLPRLFGTRTEAASIVALARGGPAHSSNRSRPPPAQGCERLPIFLRRKSIVLTPLSIPRPR